MTGLLRDQDHEIAARLRGTAAESLTWAEKLFDFLTDAQDMHRETLAGLERRISHTRREDLVDDLTYYVIEREEKFAAVMRNAYLALQIQDVTMQSIERACTAIERREAVLASEEISAPEEIVKSLTEMLDEYVRIDDLHRASLAEVA